MKIIKYIGGALRGTEEKWGGTCATNYALLKAMEGHPEFKLIAKFRPEFTQADQIEAFLAGGDITHVDDTSLITMMFKAGMPPPDVIGPITRSPVKDYKGWRSEYPAEWFYQAKVIRLNYAEELNNREQVTLIRHGINTDFLHPVKDDTWRHYVLWAGDSKRYAKNYPMMQEIIKSTTLPPPYKFKVMSNYRVEDYWKLLDRAAILVNTSRYESFCCAAFEAMARGVPVIWQKGLQGGVHEAAGIRVDYTVEAYREAILSALIGSQFLKWGMEAREYCVAHASLAVMREDLSRVYREVMEGKD